MLLLPELGLQRILHIVNSRTAGRGEHGSLALHVGDRRARLLAVRVRHPAAHGEAPANAAQPGDESHDEVAAHALQRDKRQAVSERKDVRDRGAAYGGGERATRRSVFGPGQLTSCIQTAHGGQQHFMQQFGGGLMSICGAPPWTLTTTGAPPPPPPSCACSRSMARAWACSFCCCIMLFIIIICIMSVLAAGGAGAGACWTMVVAMVACG